MDIRLDASVHGVALWTITQFLPSAPRSEFLARPWQPAVNRFQHIICPLQALHFNHTFRDSSKPVRTRLVTIPPGPLLRN